MGLLAALTKRFGAVSLLMDCYTEFAARASRYKNPVNEVGVTRLWGVDDPRKLERGTWLAFLRERGEKVYRLYEFATPAFPSCAGGAGVL